MAFRMPTISSLLLLFLISVIFFLSVNGKPIVPCYFVFGDSLFDNGNNNVRNTIAKANFLPYGIDFPGGPTGRFSNGRNVADFIAEFLGFSHHIPPFATAANVLNGVNYASGGAGILAITGKEFGDVISLDEQLQNHEGTVRKFASANKNLSHCLYSVGMGSNDYMGYSMAMPRPLPEQFAQLLIDQYSRQLRVLYGYGARKVAVFGLGTIECVPAAPGGAMTRPWCLESTKGTSGVFNAKLRLLVDVLNKELIGSKFIYVDTFEIATTDPHFNGGFESTNLPCCMITGEGMCAWESITCPNRNVFEFFDGMHPTEAAAKIVAHRAFTAQSQSDAYPYGIQHLARAH